MPFLRALAASLAARESALMRGRFATVLSLNMNGNCELADVGTAAEGLNRAWSGGSVVLSFPE